MNTSPLVSVIMPLYNAEDYLKEAVDGILAQSYSNFELIILNDGSSDRSEEICLSYKDRRIHYHFHKNMGLAGTLNKGLELCKGIYIARQDQDDIAHKDRFDKQVNYLEAHPSVLLLGTRAKVFSDTNDFIKLHDHATQPAVLKFDLLFDNPFVHSTIMFRKKDSDTIGGYNTDRSYFEDYELWSRFAQKGDVANLPDVLLDYRHHDKGLSKSTNYFKDDAVFSQSLLNIETLMGQKKEVYHELAALYHWKTDKCKGLSRAELFAGLKEMADKIMILYPDDKELILTRRKQYEKIILYRLNINQRRKYPDDKLKMFFLKLENKLKGLHANVIND
jgi:glycosyltransferase involved in cell wall biosynthesis